MPTPPQQLYSAPVRRSVRCLPWLCALLCLLCALAPRHATADGLFGLVGVPSVDIEGYGWLGDLYLEHTLKVLSTSEEQPEPQINAVFTEDSLWIISGQLQQQGYLYPAIQIRISDEAGEALYEGTWSGQELTPPLPPTIKGAHVQFTIAPGVRFYFDSITIEGLPEDFTTQPASFFYPTDQLLSFKSTRFYNKSRAISGLQGIIAHLRLMGYRDADVLRQSADIDRATGAVQFFAEIQPGPVYYAQELVIQTSSLEQASRVLRGTPLLDNPAVKPRLTPEWLQNHIQKVRNRYYEHGYPEVRITVRYEDATAPRSTEVPISNAVDHEDVPLPSAEGAAAAAVDQPNPDAATTAAATTAASATATTTAAGPVADTSATASETTVGPNATADTSPTALIVPPTATAANPATDQPAAGAAENDEPASTGEAAGATVGAPPAPASALEAATAPVAVNPGTGFDPAATTAMVLAVEAKSTEPVGSPLATAATAEGGVPAPQALREEGEPTDAAQTPATADKALRSEGESPAEAISDTGEPTDEAKTAAKMDTTAPASLQPAPAPIPHTPYTEPVTGADGRTILVPRTPLGQLEGEPGSRYQRVIIQVQSGPQVRIGKIGFAGEYGTNMSVLNSQLTIEPGQQLDRNRVEDTRNKLNALGIFRSVEIDYTEVDENTWDITYNMDMKQRTEISLIMGVGTFDIIRGGFLIEQNNLWGLAHNQRLRAVQSFKATDITYRYGIPQLFGNNLDFYAQGSYLYRQEISFNRQEYGAATGFQHYYRPLRTTFDIQYSLEQLSARNRDFLVAPGPTEATVSSITLKASHNGLDNPIFPTKGWQARASAEFAVRDLGGQVDYQRLEMSVAYHTPLNESGLIFHTGLRHGVITTTGTAQQDIPVNRRFFMGGENTVRGYRRDQAAPRDATGHQIGAVSYILWQVELEQRLTEDLSVVTFLDALGNAAEISQYPFNETVASIGIGLNYRTFVGPLRLEYGYNVKKRTGDPDGTIQVSLGFPF